MNVEIEGIVFKLLIDTGSSDLVVLGTQCETDLCLKHHRLNVKVKQNLALNYLAG